MPIYEYVCQKCGERSEAIQRLADPPLAECKACGGALRKLLSAPAFQFKGSGWYVTDYVKKSGTDSGKADKSEDSASSTSASSSSDSSSSASESSTSSSKADSGSKESASKSA